MNDKARKPASGVASVRPAQHYMGRPCRALIFQLTAGRGRFVMISGCRGCCTPPFCARCPGEIVSINTDAARAMPEVKAVYTGADRGQVSLSGC